MNTFILILLVLVLVALGSSLVYTIYIVFVRRQRGLPFPRSAHDFMPGAHGTGDSSGFRDPSSNATSWIRRMFRGRNKGGNVTEGYEGYRNTRSGRALDPDEAWDANVNTEADRRYYAEDEELGLSNHPGSAGPGRSQLDDRYDEEMHRGRSRSREPDSRSLDPRNPFNDSQALRSISPRPIDTTVGGVQRAKDGFGTVKGQGGRDVELETPTTAGGTPAERKSLFREGV